MRSNDAARGPAIGTAGWSTPRQAKPAFSGVGSQLERYAAVLPAAEINSSFHRPHRRTTYERWAASVPAPFRFSVKIPKTISHTARLVACDDLLDAFLDQIGGLGETLEVVLLQLPPSFAFEPNVVVPFLKQLRRKLPATVAIACEPRHPTWFMPDVEACLTDNHVARVAADPVLVPGGDEPGGWPSLRYYRLHGAPRIYYSSYDEAYIKALAERLFAHAKRGERIWCIFDNTASGAATQNALDLLGNQAALNGRPARPAMSAPGPRERPLA